MGKELEFIKKLLLTIVVHALETMSQDVRFGSIATVTLSALHKKSIFSLRISSVNVTKSAVFCGFGHIY